MPATPATPSAGLPATWAGAPWPPAAVWRAYLLGWVPLATVYMVASETDGDWLRGFNLWSAVYGTTRNLGPAFVLLIIVWPYSGWMERRGFGPLRLVLNHAGMALVFSWTWHALIYAVIWASEGPGQAERARANWFIWQTMWGMMLYWAAAGGFTAYRAVQRARLEAAASAQAQALLARTELAALRNKLNPHFLFNTLHSIIALTRKDASQAEAALLVFSDMLRYVLDTEKAGRDQVPLQQELDFTRAYLELEALRLGHRLQVRWEVDDAALGLPVPALSVQPLVENSIKHAFNPRSAPGLLRITVLRDDGAGQLRVRITDDGPGCAAATLASAGGLGLRTVQRRLALEHGNLGGLRISTAPGAGFSAEITLPIQPDDLAETLAP
jgi:signal transduction histidine kinase